MAKQRTTTLWMYIEQDGKNRYVKMEQRKKFRSKVEGDYTAHDTVGKVNEMGKPEDCPRSRTRGRLRNS